MRLRFDVDATSIRLRRTFDGSVHMIRFDCDTIRQHYDHRATSMRFPFDVHSLAFTFLSLSNGRGKLYYTILYYMLYAIYYILYYTILYYNSIWKLGSIDSLLNRSHKTGTIFPQPGSGRPRLSRSSEGPCGQSGGQAKKASVSSLDFPWNCHSLFKCIQKNNSPWSPAHMLQNVVLSCCLKPIVSPVSLTDKQPYRLQ